MAGPDPAGVTADGRNGQRSGVPDGSAIQSDADRDSAPPPVFEERIGLFPSAPLEPERPILPRPMLPVALAWIAGLSLGRVTMLPPWLLIAAAFVVVLFAAAGLWRARSFFVRPPTGGALLLVALGLLAWRASNAAVFAERTAALQAHEIDPFQIVRVEGKVTGRERWGPDRLRIVLERPTIRAAGGNLSFDRLALDCEMYVPDDLAGGRTPTSGEELLIGSRIRAWAQPRTADPPSHPWSHDLAGYMRRRGIGLSLRVPSASLIEEIQPAPAGRRIIESAVSAVRQYTRSVIAKRVSPEFSPIAIAVVLGDRGSLESKFRQDFRDSGLMPFLVVSGLHTGIILGLVLVGIRILRFPPSTWGWVGIVALIAYTSLVGFRPPVVRASIMGAFLLIAWSMGRPTSTLAALATAAFITLVIDPRNLMRADWQLSYACVASISVLMPPVLDLFRAAMRIEDDPHAEVTFMSNLQGAIYRHLAMPVAAVLALLMGLMPFQAAYFGQLHLSAVFSNLAAVPLVAGIMISGLLLPVIEVVPHAGSAAGEVTAACAQLLGLLAHWLSDSGVGRISLAPLPSWSGGIYTIGLLAGPHVLRGRGAFGRGDRIQQRHTALRIGFFLMVLAWAPFVASSSPPRLLQLYVLDVGQGDALVLRTPDGRVGVIDGGGGLQGGQGSRTVVPFLKGLGIRHLDFVLATHADSDHIGGLDAVIEAFNGPLVLLGPETSSSEAWHEVESAIGETHAKVIHVRAGERLEGLGPVRAEFLGPLAGLRGNDASAILLISYGEIDLLLTGDIERPAETRLLLEGRARDIEVLKVAHHGSATSTTDAFLRAFRPEVALISVGRNNRFGHPSPTVLRRLSGYHIRVARTDLQGTLLMETDGRRVRLCGYGPAAR